MANNTNVIGARYSAINSSHFCKLWAYLVYKEKLIGYKNPFAKFGTVVHDILEDYGKHCLANKFETDYVEFEKIKYRHIVKLEEWQIKDAKNVLENIKNNFNWGTYLQFDKVEIENRYAVDSNLEYTEDEDPYFSGGIDLLYFDDTTAFIEDYKTVRAIYTRAYMIESLQRKVYAFLIFKKYPLIMNTAFRFNFVRYAYLSEWFYITRDELPELEMQIKEEIEALNIILASEERPEPSAGDHCILCENRANCSAYKNAFSVDEQIYTQEDAVSLYQHYKLAKIKLKNMENALKNWINMNDPIKLKYEIYGPQVSDKVEYNDLGQLINILEKAEVPIGAIYDRLSMSHTKVKEIIKKFKLPDNVKTSIEKIARNSKTTKFETKKIEEEVMEDDEETISDQYL